MFWRLHKAVFKDRTTEALSIIKQYNHDDIVQVIEGAFTTKADHDVPHYENMPALALTTIQDAQTLLRRPNSHTGYIPWLYYHPTDYDVSNWMSNLSDNIPVLNRDGIFLPSGMLHQMSSYTMSALARKRKIFIRPNTGNKTFTGYSVNIDNWDYEIHHIQEKTSNNSLVLLAPHVELQPIEWRFWIMDKKVICYSPYSWDDDIKRRQVPIWVYEVAIMVAESEYQIDTTYVVDIVEDVERNAYVNEINATSTSGVYDVDLTRLLPELRNMASIEYKNNMEGY